MASQKYRNANMKLLTLITALCILSPTLLRADAAWTKEVDNPTDTPIAPDPNVTDQPRPSLPEKPDNPPPSDGAAPPPRLPQSDGRMGPPQGLYHPQQNIVSNACDSQNNGQCDLRDRDNHLKVQSWMN